MENQNRKESANRTGSSAGGGEAVDVKDVFSILNHRKKWIIGCAIAAVIFTIFSHYFSPSYSVKSYLILESEQENSGFQALLGSLGVSRENAQQGEAESEKNILTLKTPIFFDAFAQAVKENPEYPTYRPLLEKQLASGASLQGAIKGLFTSNGPVNVDHPATLASLLSGRVKAVSKNRGIIEATISSVNPSLSVFLGNIYQEVATQTFSAREEKKLKVARDYIQNKIEETVRKMEQTDREIVGTNTKNASLSLLAPQNAIAEKLLQLKADIQKLKITYEQNAKVVDKLKARLASTGETPLVPGTDEGDTSVFGLRRTIANLTSENELLQLRIDSMQKGLDSLLKSNLSLPKEEQALTDLRRQKGLDYYVFDNLFKTHLQLEVKGLSLLNRVYPLNKITAPEVYTTTQLFPKMTLAFVAALLLSSLAIYGMQLVSPVVRTKKDFDDFEISFLGNVPEIDAKYFEDVMEANHLCRFDIDSKETISFKLIRSRLNHLSQHSGSKQRKVISILSYGNNEGKSFISSNLAACFAHMGKRTLLVDFDLRRAMLTKLFHLTEKPGLCSYFEDQIPIENLIVREVQPTLDILPAGVMTERTTELLSNQAFNQLIERLRGYYDFIIIDTAPVLVAYESIVIAKESDFAVLLATSWRTNKEYIRDALEEIRNVRNASVHFILNKAVQDNVSLVSNYYYIQSPSKAAMAKRQAAERQLDN